MKQEYELMWEEGLFPLIWIDLIEFAPSKSEISSVFIFRNGITTTFYSKKSLQKAYENGLKIYSNKNRYKTLFKKINKFFDFALNFFEKNMVKEKIGKLDNKKLHVFFNKSFKVYKKMLSFYALTEPWMSELIEEKIVQGLKEKGLKTHLTALLKDSSKVKQLHLSKKTCELIESLNVLGKFHFKLRMKLEKSISSGYVLLKEIAKRFNKSINQVESCTIKEIDNLILRNHFSIEVNKRLNYFVAVQTINGKKVLTREKAKQFEEDFFPKIDFKKISEVKGKIANLGKAIGRVRKIFFGQKDCIEKMNEMMEGEILVSTETTPSLMPAIKKAAAIVTEVGGITSHASIVSRELGKPCIVGAKFATKIFKDGEKIEVDATLGVARRLK